MITYVRVDNRVVVNINGHMHKIEGAFASDVVKQAALAKQEEDTNPTWKQGPERDKLMAMLASGYRIPLATDGRFDFEPNTGKLIMKGYSRAVPKVLTQRILQYIEEKLPVDGLVNFWQWCLLNPDRRVLDGQLFEYLQHNGHPITDNGYFLSYKKVKVKEKVDQDLVAYITESAEKIRRWKKSLKVYAILESPEAAGGYFMTTEDKVTDYISDFPRSKRIGNLQELVENLSDIDTTKTTIYTDLHTGTMDIRLGVPVKQDRAKCDPNPNVTCSTGLHVGNMFYVGNNFGSSNWGNNGEQVLVCLINPMNVVSIPYDYNNTKMRCCEYFPLMILNPEEKEGIKDVHFESEYMSYEKKELEEMLSKLSVTNVDYEGTDNAEEDSKQSDAVKVIKERLKIIK